MSVILQVRRDTTANIGTQVGAQGELWMQTDSTPVRLLLGDGTNPSANNKVAMYSDLTTGTSINANFATLGLGGSAGSNALSVTAGSGSTQGSALFNNNAGQFTFTVNRNTGSYNAACAFQTNYTTQAQFGLLGNNNLSFQVGTGFTTGLTLDNTTAIPSFPTAPKFSATNSSAQTLTTASTVYTLLAQTVNYQVGSNYNASTGIFTAPIAGYYQFYVSCKISGITSASATSPVNANIQFYLNGSALAYTNEVVTCYCSNTNISVSSSLLINLTAGQTVNSTVSCSYAGVTVVSGTVNFLGFLVP